MAQQENSPILARFSPWHFGGLTRKQLLLETWREMQEDDAFGRAAQLAYYFFFALFPLVIFLTALLGIFSAADSDLVQNLTREITRSMPASATGLVQQTIHKSLSSSGGGKLAFGIVLALLSASSGMVAMMEALNVVFDAPVERTLLRQRFTALWLTIVVGLLICVSTLLITIGGKVAAAVAGGALYWIWQIIQYPLAIVLLVAAFSVVYYFAPNVEQHQWRWVTPGALAGVGLWAIASFGLRTYLHEFNSYTSDYGTMGAVMVLMLWFYITGLAFLIGGEIDAIIERAVSGKAKRGRQLASDAATPQKEAKPSRAA